MNMVGGYGRADHQSTELEIFGFRERHIPRPVHSFVTISIDGEQQAEISHSIDTLNPKWVFDKPLQLYVFCLNTGGAVS